MLPIDKFISAAERVTGAKGKKAGGWIRFPHPCSPDKDSQLSFAVKEAPDGTVHIVSHKPSYDHDACLDALGLTKADYFPETDKRGPRKYKETQTVWGYEYMDAKGELVGRVARVEDKSSFPQGRYENGKFVSGLGDKVLPLYQIDRIIDAVRAGHPIYICEGEKDCIALWRAGVAATTKSGGAKAEGKKGAWTPEIVAPLKGAHVTIIADRDDPGREDAQCAFHALRKIAKSVRIVEAAEGKDASDHLAAGYKIDDFIERDDLVPRLPGFAGISFNGVFKNVEPEFLWEPYFPLGKAILVDAHSGVGKSTMLLGIAAGLSQGITPKGGSCEPARTLYFIGDNDTPEECETVYRANGGREKWVTYVKEPFSFSPEAFERIENYIREVGARLVIFDPFTYWMPVRDINDSVQVLPFCQEIGRIAERTGATIVAVRHVPKSALQAGGLFAGIGSVQFRASFRGNLLVRPHPEEAGMTVVTDDKGSLLVERGKPLAFRRRNRWEVEWLADFDENPFEKAGERRDSGRPGVVGAKVKDEIERILAKDIVKTGDLMTAVMKSCDCSRPTFFRTIKQMGVTASNGYYSLPPDYDPFADDNIDHVYRGGD